MRSSSVMSPRSARPLAIRHHRTELRPPDEVINSPSLLLRIADRLASFDGELAREAFLEALDAALSARRNGSRGGLVLVADAARRGPSANTPPRAVDLLLEGLITRVSEGYRSGVSSLGCALRAFGEAEYAVEDLRWLRLAFRIAMELWDDEGWQHVVDRFASSAPSYRGRLRDERHAAGRHLGEAPFGYSAENHSRENTGVDSYEEGLIELRSLLVGLNGHRLNDAGIQDGEPQIEGVSKFLVEYSQSVVCNGLGCYEYAYSAAQRALTYEDVGLHGWVLCELVEASARTDREDSAADALTELSRMTQSSATEWALGMEARSRALLHKGKAAEELYCESIGRLSRTRARVHLARAQLLYGEWLRRENRRVDARQALHSARATFEASGARVFAERSLRELIATGETARKRTEEDRFQLTAQEWQIAQLAGRRLSNAEIATQLFISPRTVEWHLHKVFTKLGVNSRKQLAAAPQAC